MKIGKSLLLLGDARFMGIRLPLFFLFALAAFLTMSPHAQAKYASMVIDAESGEVFHSVNADVRNYPASLTKMMTLYLLFDQLDSGRVKLTDRIPVSARAAGQSPSKLGLTPGQTLSVEQAILGLCTKSANDAAVAVGEFLGGSEAAFAEQMTRKAAELGMRQTQFRNASGLPNLGQYSTARDMATLARALIHNHPRQYRYFSTGSFTYNGNNMRNHNRMLEWYDGVDGIKTGYIAASGFNLVASAKRGNRRLIGVVFGGQSAAQRDRHMGGLLDAAFARAPGSGGVDMASLPAQTEPERTSIAAKAPVPAETNTDYRAVMRAMAMAKEGQMKTASLKPAKGRAPAKAEETGDAGADDEGWGIQVGAFSKQTSARDAANAAKHKLGKLASEASISVLRAKSEGKTHLFRARVEGLSEESAREACRRLAKSKTSCSVFAAR